MLCINPVYSSILGPENIVDAGPSCIKEQKVEGMRLQEVILFFMVVEITDFVTDFHLL